MEENESIFDKALEWSKTKSLATAYEICEQLAIWAHIEAIMGKELK